MGEFTIVGLSISNPLSKGDLTGLLSTLFSSPPDWAKALLKRNNIDITPKITKYHSEINNPEDKHPEEMSCQELANVEPQIFFTNLMAATFMCCAFYNVIIKENFKYSEVYFDMLSMKSDSKVREV